MHAACSPSNVSNKDLLSMCTGEPGVAAEGKGLCDARLARHDASRCIKQASSCAVQLPLLYRLCERRIRHFSAVRAMSGSFNGSDLGFKHEQLYSRQDDSAGSTASTAPVSCFA